jgi:hypothetical protein
MTVQTGITVSMYFIYVCSMYLCLYVPITSVYVRVAHVLKGAQAQPFD